MRDEACVDDAVQETLRRALGSKAAGSIERPRAWLAQIMRHYVSGMRRKGAWREEMEDGEGLSIPEGAASDPAEITLRLERQRVVGEELRALDRTMRDALFLRYYEELSVKGIAQALGITRSAAESRVYRGRELLRERLEARFGPARGGASDGSWMSALISLVGAPAGNGARLRSIGSMQRIGWAPPAILAAAALIICAMVWVRSAPVAKISVLEPVLQAEVLAAIDAPPKGSGDRAREEVVSAPEEGQLSETVAAPPAASFVFGAQVEDGTPLIGEPAAIAEVMNGGGMGRLRLTATDESGLCGFERLTPGDYFFAGGSLQGLNSDVAVLESGKPRKVESRSHGTAYPIELRLDAPTVDAGQEVQLWVTEQLNGVMLSLPCATFAAGEPLTAHCTEYTTFIATTAGHLPSDPMRFMGTLPRDGNGVRRVDLTASAGGGVVAGRVVDSNGKPVPEATVVLDETAARPAVYPQRTRPRFSLVTDEAGVFRSDFHLAQGELQVEVHANGFGLWRGSLAHDALGSPWTIQLNPERILRGRVVDEAGDPVEGVRVTANLSGEWYPSTSGFHEGPIYARPHVRTDESGGFVIRGLGAERVVLLARWLRSGADGTLWRRETIEDSLGKGGGVAPLEIVMTMPVLVAGTALDEGGAPIAGIRVEARSDGSRHAGWCMTDSEGGFVIRQHAYDTPVPDGDALRLRFAQESRFEGAYEPLHRELGVITNQKAGDLDVVATLPSPVEPTCTLRGVISLDESLESEWELSTLQLGVQCSSVYEGIQWTPFDRATGAFDLSPLPPAIYSLAVREKGTSATLLSISTIDLGPDQVLDLGLLTISKEGPKIQVSVLDADSGQVLGDKALGEHSVLLRGTDRLMGIQLRDEGALWSNFTALEPGTWKVTLRSRTYRAEPVEVVVGEGETAIARLVARPR